MITLLEIDGVDFSKAVNRREYNINHSDIYKEWTDINLRKHREIIRREIGGDLQLTFLSDSAEGFITHSGELITTQNDSVITTHDGGEGTWDDWYAMAQRKGAHTINIFVSSLNEIVSLNGFIDYTARAIRMNEANEEKVGIIVVDCKVTEQ